jgi:hypothetical protein
MTAPDPLGGAMVPVPKPDGGAAVPRAALERVLARAAELQQAAVAPDGQETVPEAVLLEIAREVGLDASHVRQALAEERARGVTLPDDAGGWMLALLGEARLGAQRIVPGTPAAVVAALSDTLTRQETMVVMRRTDAHHSWEPREDFGAGLQRMLSSHRYALAGVDLVAATVTAVDGGRTLVRLDATMHRVRRQGRAAVVGSWAAFGVVGAAVAALVSFIPVSPAARTVAMAGVAAFALGAGALVWGAVQRGYRRTMARAQLRLEQLLDERERG